MVAVILELYLVLIQLYHNIDIRGIKAMVTERFRTRDLRHWIKRRQWVREIYQEICPQFLSSKCL